MTALVLGIDGGGTKTEAAVVDADGRVVWRDRTGGLDPTAGPEWEIVLEELAGRAGPVAQAALGLPYHGEIAEISRRQNRVSTQHFGTSALVANDVALAFEGALAGADGVLVLAGTGSMAWARGPLGTHRVGGWGDLVGDEGSAYWIGRKALARISRELDGRDPDSGFANAMLAEMGIAPEALSAWAYAEAARARIAGLATAVSTRAQAGDVIALGLLQAAGEELGLLGQTAVRLCGTADRWSYAGGVMANPTVLATVTAAMGSPPVPPVLPPVGGAVLAAAKAAGWATGSTFLHRLKQELR
jgi:N-acetylglucosamine kinase